MRELENEPKNVSSVLEKLNHDRLLDQQSSKKNYSGKSADWRGILPSCRCTIAREWEIPPLTNLPDQKMTLMWVGRWNGFAVSLASETNNPIRLLQVSGELVQVLVNSNELQS